MDDVDEGKHDLIDLPREAERIVCSDLLIVQSGTVAGSELEEDALDKELDEWIRGTSGGGRKRKGQSTGKGDNEEKGQGGWKGNAEQEQVCSGVVDDAGCQKMACSRRVVKVKVEEKGVESSSAQPRRLLFFSGCSMPMPPLYRYTIVYKPAWQGKGNNLVKTVRTEPLADWSVKNIQTLVQMTIKLEPRNLMNCLVRYNHDAKLRVFSVTNVFWRLNPSLRPPDTCNLTGVETPIFHEEDVWRYRGFWFLYHVLCAWEKDTVLRGQEGSTENEVYLRSVRFFRHPEVIRFYGGQAFAELCNFYHAEWVMGLRLHDVYSLHHRLRTRPELLVFLRADERLVARSHSYGTEGRSGLQRALRAVEYMRAVNNWGCGEHIVRVLVVFAVDEECGGQGGRHRYVPGMRLVYLASQWGERVSRVLGRQLNVDKRSVAAAVVALAEDRIVFVEHEREEHGTGVEDGLVEMRKALGAPESEEDGFGSFGLEAVSVYKYDMYVEELILMRAYRRLMNNARALEPYRPPADCCVNLDRFMCSEQALALRKSVELPLLLLTGKPGSGKTLCLENIVQMYRPDHVLCVAFMNTHLDNMRERVMARATTHPRLGAVRFSTMDRLMNLHRYFCKACLPRMTTQNEDEGWKAMCKKMKENMMRWDMERSGNYHRVCADDALFNYPFENCMLEDVEVLVVEEASLMSYRNAAKLMWVVTHCAPALRLVVYCGDDNQLEPLAPGNLFKKLIEAFPQCVVRFEHCHRFQSMRTFANVNHILNQQPDRVQFDDKKFVLVPADVGDYLSRLQQVALSSYWDLEATQFVARTNRVRNEAAKVIMRNMVDDPKGYNPMHFYAGQSIMYKKNSGDDVAANTMFTMHCVVHVQVEVCADAVALQEKRVSSVVAEGSVMEHVMNNGPVLVEKNVVASAGLTPTQMAQVYYDNERSIDEEQNPELADARSVPDMHKKFGLALLKYIRHPEKVLQDSFGQGNEIEVPVDQRTAATLYRNMYDSSSTVKLRVTLHQVEKSTVVPSYDQNFTTPLLVCTRRRYDLWESEDLLGKERLYFLPFSWDMRGFVKDATVVTCHNMMGREAPRVVYIDPKATRYAYNNILYTACTRAKEQCVLLMHRDQFAKACCRPSPLVREKLGEVLEEECGKSLEAVHTGNEVARAVCALLEMMERKRYGVRNNKCVKDLAEWKQLAPRATQVKLSLKKLVRQSDGNFDDVKWKVASRILGVEALEALLTRDEHVQVGDAEEEELRELREAVCGASGRKRGVVDLVCRERLDKDSKSMLKSIMPVKRVKQDCERNVGDAIATYMRTMRCADRQDVMVSDLYV